MLSIRYLAIQFQQILKLICRDVLKRRRGSIINRFIPQKLTDLRSILREKQSSTVRTNFVFIVVMLLGCLNLFGAEDQIQVSSTGLPLYYWKDRVLRADTMNGETFVNFGDLLSLKLVERIVGGPVGVYVKKKQPEKKLLAIGSIFYFASDNDVVWGSGINGKTLKKSDYNFTGLDVRAVRGPLTRQFLMENFNIISPEIYGDPALLLPYFFPEFKRKTNPSHPYVIMPHYADAFMFLNGNYENVIFPWDPWEEIIKKILDSEFVISSTLHGIVVAEAYGVPARMLRVSNNQNIFKYNDYYCGTNRPNYLFATSVEEALRMGGETPFQCNLEKLYASFPFELWPNNVFIKPNFRKGNHENE